MDQPRTSLTYIKCDEADRHRPDAIRRYFSRALHPQVMLTEAYISALMVDEELAD